MKNKVSPFLEVIDKLINSEQDIPEVKLRAMMSKFVEDLSEAAQINININNTTIQSNDLYLLTAKLKNSFTDESDNLSKKNKDKFKKQLNAITNRKISLFTEDQKNEINQDLLNIQNEQSDAKIKKLAESLKEKISTLLSVDDYKRGFEAKITEAWKEFDDVKEVEKKETSINIILLEKLIEFTANSANDLYTEELSNKNQKAAYEKAAQKAANEGKVDEELKNREIASSLDGTLIKNKIKIDEEFKAKINSMLNIPMDKEKTIKDSDEYRKFMKLVVALRDRKVKDLETQKYEEKFTPEAKEKRKAAFGYNNRSYSEKQKFEQKESIISSLAFFHEIGKFFNYLVSALISLLGKIHLVSEETQIYYTKDTNSWDKFVAQRGTEDLVKGHSLVPRKI